MIINNGDATAQDISSEKSKVEQYYKHYKMLRMT